MEREREAKNKLHLSSLQEFSHTAVVSVSKKSEPEKQEDLEIGRHNIRCAAAG